MTVETPIAPSVVKKTEIDKTTTKTRIKSIKKKKYVDYSGAEYWLITAPRAANLPIPLTGKTESFKLQFLVNNSSENIRIIKPKKTKIMHYNVFPTPSDIELYEAVEPTEDMPYQTSVRVGTYFTTQSLCNDFKCKDVFEDINVVWHLINFLEKPNPSSAYDPAKIYLQKHVSLKHADKAVFCRDCKVCITPDDNPIYLYTGYCADCLPDNINEVNLSFYSEAVFKKLRQDDHYYITRRTKNKSTCYPEITGEQISRGYENLQKVTKDVICLGLGSAGTNLLDQMSRLTFLNTFKLIDFDSVENKNLRNQFYNKNDVSKAKSEASVAYLKYLNKKAKGHNRPFQKINFKYVRSKYIILGFDTIETRLEAFQWLQNGMIESKYLIDLRYDDIDASIYFIDMSNEEQVAHYHERLLVDKAAFDVFKPYTIDDVSYFFEQQRPVKNCARVRRLLTNDYAIDLNMCQPLDDSSRRTYFLCESNECKEHCLQFINEHQFKIVRKPVDNTCVKQNIIDIYKYASTFITCAIRETEEGREQPFYHIECTTNPIPSHIKIR